jgi:hypothetical protein
MDTKLKINEMIKDIKLKAASEARYYQGAIDSLVLLLENLDKQIEETESSGE